MRRMKLRTTSPLRRERNINNPRTCLQNRGGTGFGSLTVLFMESLLKRGVELGIIVGFCTELRPFLEYIENTRRVTGAAGLTGSDVAAYAAAVSTAYESGEKTFTSALNANGLLSAVRMFCLYLHTAGMVPYDYGLSVPGILFPDVVAGTADP